MNVYEKIDLLTRQTQAHAEAAQDAIDCDDFDLASAEFELARSKTQTAAKLYAENDPC